MFESLVFLVFPAAMAFAGAMDLLTMTIPNRISLVLLAVFPLAAALSGLPAQTLLVNHVAVGFGVLIVFWILNELKVIGGGDAKLLAVSSLWIGYDHLLPFMVLVSLAGGVLSVVLLAYRRMVPMAVVMGTMPKWAERLHEPGSAIPYGIAITGGALSIYPNTHWFFHIVH